MFYRAHLVGGNTTYVADLCAALEAAGADALAIFTYSLRADADGAVPAVALAKDHGVDVVITSTLAAGRGGRRRQAGRGHGRRRRGTRRRCGRSPPSPSSAVPVIQAPSSSRSRPAWADDHAGLAPVDVAMGVAIPEFDGRIIGPDRSPSRRSSTVGDGLGAT